MNCNFKQAVGRLAVVCIVAMVFAPYVKAVDDGLEYKFKTGESLEYLLTVTNSSKTGDLETFRESVKLGLAIETVAVDAEIGFASRKLSFEAVSLDSKPGVKDTSEDAQQKALAELNSQLSNKKVLFVQSSKGNLIYKKSDIAREFADFLFAFPLPEERLRLKTEWIVFLQRAIVPSEMAYQDVSQLNCKLISEPDDSVRLKFQGLPDHARALKSEQDEEAAAKNARELPVTCVVSGEMVFDLKAGLVKEASYTSTSTSTRNGQLHTVINERHLRLSGVAVNAENKNE